MWGLFYKIRDKCWSLIDKEYPEVKTKYDRTAALLVESLNELPKAKKVIVFDAGCGHFSLSNLYKGGDVVLVGADMDFNAVKRNTAISFGYVCDLGRVPMKNCSVDAVICNMVVEHLREPGFFFSEVARILLPGGFLVLSTPCVYNVVVAFNRLIPHALSKKLGKFLTGEGEGDIFPTLYRANSARKLRQFFRKNGLCEVGLIMYQPPPYAFVFSVMVCRLMIFYYKLISRYDCFRYLRGVIIARARKL